MVANNKKEESHDFISRRKVPRKTDQNNINAWTFNDYQNYQPAQKNLHDWRDVKVA